MAKVVHNPFENILPYVPYRVVLVEIFDAIVFFPDCSGVVIGAEDMLDAVEEITYGLVYHS